MDTMLTESKTESTSFLKEGKKMETLKYKFYSDPGHGWLAVKRSELERLGILSRVTSCSYQRGDTVYLEEDGDASLFLNAKKQANEPFEIIEKNYPRDYAPIRSYDHFDC